LNIYLTGYFLVYLVNIDLSFNQLLEPLSVTAVTSMSALRLIIRQRLHAGIKPAKAARQTWREKLDL